MGIEEEGKLIGIEVIILDNKRVVVAPCTKQMRGYSSPEGTETISLEMAYFSTVRRSLVNEMHTGVNCFNYFRYYRSFSRQLGVGLVDIWTFGFTLGERMWWPIN